MRRGFFKRLLIRPLIGIRSSDHVTISPSSPGGNPWLILHSPARRSILHNYFAAANNCPVYPCPTHQNQTHLSVRKSPNCAILFSFLTRNTRYWTLTWRLFPPFHSGVSQRCWNKRH